MPDGESTTPGPRKRPVYGRPAPASAGAASGPDSAAHSGSAHSGSAQGASVQGGSAHSGFTHSGFAQDPSSQGSFAHEPYPDTPATGPLPAQPPRSSGGSSPSTRRGLAPLIIGLVLLLIIGPAATIGGLVWSFSSLVGDATTGPTVVEGGTGELEIGKNEMLILYVPAADADSAQCTAEGSSSGAVTEFPTSGSVTFGNGTSYEQALGVAATADTTVTISCTGTDSPAYLGPYSVTKMAAPMLIGPIIGIIAGLIGLILTIIGIVRLVRSRRA